jgi:hypothetical protein
LNQSSTDSVDCYLMEEYGSCWGPTDYEHEGNPCCVLHFPSEDKKVAFRTALEAKLKDEDFNFSGAYFPSGMALFGDYATQMERHRRGVRLRTGLRFRTQLEEASFREATFSGEVDFKEVTFHGAARRTSVEPFSVARQTSETPYSAAEHTPHTSIHTSIKPPSSAGRPSEESPLAIRRPSQKPPSGAR